MLENKSVARRGKDFISISSNGSQPNKLSTELDSETFKQKCSSNSEHIDVSYLDPDSLTLWQHPVTTITFFLRELLIDCGSLCKKILRHYKLVISTVLIILCFVLLSRISGPQQQVSFYVKVTIDTVGCSALHKRFINISSC